IVAGSLTNNGIIQASGAGHTLSLSGPSGIGIQTAGSGDYRAAAGPINVSTDDGDTITVFGTMNFNSTNTNVVLTTSTLNNSGMLAANGNKITIQSAGASGLTIHNQIASSI